MPDGYCTPHLLGAQRKALPGLARKEFSEKYARVLRLVGVLQQVRARRKSNDADSE
jgi:hypothetical protein